MAIRGGDGSIILTTAIDIGGISKGSNTIKSMLQSVGNSATSTVAKIQSAFVSLKNKRTTFQTLTQAIKDQQYVIKSLSEEYAELVAKGKQNSTEAINLKGRIEELTAEMKELQFAANSVDTTGGTALGKLGNGLKMLASYLIGIQTVFAFINFSKDAGQMATQQEASIQRLIDIYGEASQTVGNFIDANARGLGLSKSMATSVSVTYGNLLSVWADQETNANLTNNLLNQTAVVASKTGRTVEDVAERIRSGLLGNTEAIEDLGINVNIKTIEITDAFKRIADGRSWQQLSAYEQAQVKTLTILEQSTNKYGTTVAQTSSFTRQQYRAAYEDMQATWGQFVNVVLMPVLKVVTQTMNIITAGLRAIAGITGKTIESTEGVSSSIGGAVDNQNALTDAVKGTNKEMKKTLAGFDEIQILSSNTADSSGVAGDAVADLGLTDSGGTGGQEEGISTMLATIMGVIGGAMIALGVLLIWNGHIGWGIGFIITGASALGVSAAAVGNAELDFSTQFSSIMTMVGGALLALGLVLFFQTKDGLAHSIGLGMIVAGAGILAIGAIQMAANEIGGEVGTMLHGIITVVSGFLLAIGIIMMFGGFSPLALGLIITGAVGLASEVALYPDEVVSALQGWLGVIMTILSSALLVIGILMCCTGHITPLSVGLIVVGAVGLTAEIAVNWNWLSEQLQGTLGLISAIVGAALLALGIIIVAGSGGVANGLGIALIIAGAVALVAPLIANFGYIVDVVSKVIGVLTLIVSAALLVMGVILLFTGAGIPLGLGLIFAGAALLGFAAKSFDWDWLPNGVRGVINSIIGIVEKGVNWLIDKINVFISGIDMAVSAVGDLFGQDWNVPLIPNISIPRLARGAVIPPNREFLAILGDQKHGTNIEAPLQTIVDAFNIALQGNAYTGGGNTEVVLEIDGREFGRAIVEQGNKENRRIGTRLVIV